MMSGLIDIEENMRLKNHEITKIIKEMTAERVYQDNETRRIIDFHLQAKARYQARHALTDNRHQSTAAFLGANTPRPTAASLPRTHTPNTRTQPEIHIHIHNSYATPLWYDWWCWRMLTWDLFARPYPQPTIVIQHQNKSKSENNQPSAEQILLALVLAVGAAVSTLYSFIEIGRCVDQLAYAEDIFANLTRISIGVVGALGGGIAGYALGGSLLAMPMLASVMSTLIFAGLSIWASKLLIESLHKANDTTSALDYDPRFCLSESEKTTLQNRGYDIDAVSEAIREVAIVYDTAHENAWSLTFWSPENREKAVMVDLLRSLKSGRISKELEFNQKIFSLKPAHAPRNEEPQFYSYAQG